MQYVALYERLSRDDQLQGESNSIKNQKEYFIKHMNKSLKEYDHSIMLIAEDSTSFEGVTKPVDENGLGFDYKWDMGWMNDTLDYFKTNPNDRKRDYHKLTFSMMYFGSENFLLPFSHDEVVHGKATIVQKMNGQYEDKFPQARVLYMYMYTHPGKKLNFMGNEIGQLREWDEKREQDFNILQYPVHDSFAKYIRELCFIYNNNPALYELDYEKKGFQWIDCHQEEKCIYVYERAIKNQRIIIILNLSNVRQIYELKVEGLKSMKLLLASDNEKYGGCVKYPDILNIKIEDGIKEIKINAFTGLMFEVV